MNTKPTFDYEALAEKTSDAYSAASFTSWKSVAELLARRGYDEMQAEAILRSKWTRWCRDAWNGSGIPTSNALANYLDKNKCTPKSEDVIRLTKEHWQHATEEVGSLELRTLRQKAAKLDSLRS